MLVEQDREGPSVIVYAAVSWHGKTSLFLRSACKSIKISQMLTENVFPEIRGVMNRTDWTWQQDDATPHTAKETQQWLRKNCPCLLYTSPSPRDGLLSRMPSSA